MTLNTVSFKQDSGDFQTVITDDTQTFQMLLFDFNENESHQAESIASSICDWLDSNLLNVKFFSASMLINIKNGSWLEDGEEPVSEQYFIQKIQLDAINAYSDGSFNLFFKDGDLFLGHQIIVNVNKDFLLMDVEIAG